MSRLELVPGVLFAVLLALVPVRGRADRVIMSSADTATFTPVPTATMPSLAPAGELLHRMQQVVRRTGSVRVVTTSVTVTKRERATGTTRTDMSWRDDSLRERDVWHRVDLNRRPAVRTVERRTLLVAHHMAASRGTSNRSWYCERLPGVRVGTSFLPFQIGTPPVTNLGAAMVGGVAVWHVRAMGAIIQARALRAATADFYIGQADSLLRELWIHGSQRIGGVTSQESIRERYSRYGEMVRVTLPAACRPSTARGAPPDTRLEQGGGGGSPDRMYSDAELIGKLDLAALAEHYTPQIERAGWTRQDAGQSGPLIWSTWTFEREQEPWRGIFYVLQRPDLPGHFAMRIQAEAAIEDDDRPPRPSGWTTVRPRVL